MHKCEYTDRIEIKYGKLTRIIKAAYIGRKKYFEMDVLKQDEELVSKCRNIYYRNLGGYYVLFPEEKYYGQINGTDSYGLTSEDGKKELPLYCSNKTTAKDYYTVTQKYPDFKKILEIHYFERNSELLKAVHYWKNNKKDFKFLIENQKFQMAYSNSFYMLSDKRKQEIKKAILTYPTSDIDTKKFLKVMSLKNEFPEESFKDLYNVNYGNTNNKETNLAFFRKTKEWKKLTEEEQTAFEDFYLNSKSWLTQYFSYPKFRRIVKDRIRYRNTGFEELLSYEKKYMNRDELRDFYCRYNKDLTYTYQKADKADFYYSTDTVEKIFEIWKKYPREIEGLFSLKLTGLATDSDYYLESEDFRKKALKFFLKHKDFCSKHKNLSLTDLKRMLDLKCYDVLTSDSEMTEYIYKNLYNIKDLDRKQVEYLKQNKIEADEYNCYLRKCTQAGHNTEEEYWKLPKNFKRSFHKVEREIENIEKYQNEHKDECYLNAVQNFIKKNPKMQIDGFEIYIPETIEDIKLQADTLHQCLIRLDYPKKVIDRKCILVFLRKDGVPMATCELNQKTIVQFRQNNNESVTNEMDRAMNKWLEKAELQVA